MQTDPKYVMKPVFRALRVFAVDPGMTARFETALLNEQTLSIPWEDLEPGPAGEYIEVVDRNRDGARVHEPVDLECGDLLAQDGLPPSDGNPQFRQQMVYAVAMRTIRTFERALGRVVHWRPHAMEPTRAARRAVAKRGYVRRLRIYPHFAEQANAFYVPEEVAL